MKTMRYGAVWLGILVSAASAQEFQLPQGCQLPFAEIQERHEIDDQCSADGTKRGGGDLSPAKLASNRAKNDFCRTGTPLPMTLSIFKRLQTKTLGVKESDLDDRPAALANVIKANGKVYGEGKVVRYIAYILHAKYSNVKSGKKDTKFGESVNCYRPAEEDNDIHIVLGRTLDDEPCETVTAEMSPHFRPVAWTPDNLNSVRRHPVRLTGHLFFDSSHKPCKNGTGKPARVSVWELHPVYAVEVCRKTSLQACKTGPKSNWVPLDKWFGEDEHEEDDE